MFKCPVARLDDDYQNLLMFERFFESIGYAPSTFRTTNAFFESITDADPDLIIIDLRLAGDLSGIDVCDELRAIERFRITPVVAITAVPVNYPRDTAMEHGFSAYFTKPFVPAEFRRLVRELLGDS
ncbi:MAG: response regulator [Chloroflexota bacterium]